MEEIVHIKPG